MNIVKNVSHITKKQQELLIKFIEEHPEMNSGKFSETYTKAKAKGHLLGSPANEWTQWRK